MTEHDSNPVSSDPVSEENAGSNALPLSMNTSSAVRAGTLRRGVQTTAPIATTTARRLQSTASSSPMRYPAGSSSPPSSGVEYNRRQTGTSSPMRYPATSSPPREPASSVTEPRVRARGTAGTPPSTDVLFSSQMQMPTGGWTSELNSQQPLVAATPRSVRRRNDLGNSQTLIDTDFNMSQLMTDQPQAGTQQDSNPSQNGVVRVIWGTDIVIDEATRNFKKFLQEFTLAHRRLQENLPLREQDTDPFYYQLMQQIGVTEIPILNLNVQNLQYYEGTKVLAEQLILYPQEIIPLMDLVANQYFMEQFPQQNLNEPIQIRPFNTGNVVNMRDLDPKDIDKLVTVKGLVIRTSSIIPDMKTAFFKCSTCHTTLEVESIKGRIDEPNRCPNEQCKMLHGLVLEHNRCLFSDKQNVRVQETPDTVPDGQTPHTVTMCVYDSLVDGVRPGDRVEMTGIFRAAPVRLNPRQRTIKSHFRTFLDVVHVRRLDEKQRASQDVTSQEFILSNDEQDKIKEEEMERVAEIKQFSQQPELYDVLSKSIAPSVWGHEDVKKGLLLQLFGGVTKMFKKGGSSRFRGDINVLLAGDPGVSKSQLLQHVHKLAPRGIYTSGKGSSAVGLTAYIVRDPESKQIVLESGALVLSDGGICCIDEFDKMSEATRSILHEAMEQQTVSIAKRGIIATLNARTSVLASANPVDSKYNPMKSIVENLNLPPTLLSRFDLIFVLLDTVHEQRDKRLALHIASLYLSGVSRKASSAATSDCVSSDFLTDYIAYARENVKPVLDDEACTLLMEGYVGLRRANGVSSNTVSATTRQLESMIRLAEAHARMRLSDQVQSIDALEAIRLIKAALLMYAMDPRTGRIDMDLVNTGRSAASRELASALKKQVKEVLLSRTDAVSFTALLQQLNENASMPVTDTALREVIMELAEEDTIFVSGHLRRGQCEIRRIV